jgi:hypothetical protein
MSRSSEGRLSLSMVTDAPVEYNYRNQAQLEQANVAWRDWSGEQPGMSAFALDGDSVVYHT